MSAEMAFGSLLGKQSNNQLLEAIERLEQAILQQSRRQPQYFVFLQSNNNVLSSNVTDGTLILNGPVMGIDEVGVIEDFNINFTTAAGTIRLVIVDAQNTILKDVLRDITSSTNGTGRTVIQNGQRLAIVGQSAGAGVFGIFCSGFKAKTQ